MRTERGVTGAPGGERRLGRGWRVAVTAACFAAFGLGGLLFPLLLPLLALGCSALERRRRVRSLVGATFRGLVRVLEASGVMRLEVSGVEGLAGRRATVIVANHPTYLDVVVVLSLIPQAGCIVKKAVWNNPFFGMIVRSAGYVSNDSPAGLVALAAGTLRHGDNLVIFPEGTRSDPRSIGRFQRGAAHIALECGADILPVIIDCDPPTLTRRHRWHEVPARPFRLRLAFGQARPPGRWVTGEQGSAPSPRQLTRALENHFIREIHGHDRVAA